MQAQIRIIPRCDAMQNPCDLHFEIAKENNQRAPKGPPNEDPPKSGLGVSACSFSSPSPPFRSCLAVSDRCQNLVCFSIRMTFSLLECLLLVVASVVKNPTMIRVTRLCGRALFERALWRPRCDARDVGHSVQVTPLTPKQCKTRYAPVKRDRFL